MGELVRICAGECAAVARSLADVEDPWEGFAGMVRAACENSAEDAASRRTWQVADDEALAYAADVKAELHEAASVLIDRAHGAGHAAPGLHDRRHAGADVRPRRGDRRDARADDRWRRLVEFALDGLKAR